MPILFSDSAATDELLRGILDDHRATIEGLLQVIARMKEKGGDPASLRTAEELARDLLDLVRLSTAADAERSLRLTAANVTYDGFLAITDLVKTHSGDPIVPRSSKARTESTPS